MHCCVVLSAHWPGRINPCFLLYSMSGKYLRKHQTESTNPKQKAFIIYKLVVAPHLLSWKGGTVGGGGYLRQRPHPRVGQNACIQGRAWGGGSRHTRHGDQPGSTSYELVWWPYFKKAKPPSALPPLPG